MIGMLPSKSSRLGQVFLQMSYFWRSSASPFVKNAANRACTGVPSGNLQLNDLGIQFIVNIASSGTLRSVSPFYSGLISNRVSGSMERRTLMFRVAIMPRPRPGNCAGATPFGVIPWEMAHPMNNSCCSPGHQAGFILL